MPLIQDLLTLLVVGVLLWLVNLIAMQGTIKSILNSIVVIFVVIWLLNVFGLMPYCSRIRVGNMHFSSPDSRGIRVRGDCEITDCQVSDRMNSSFWLPWLPTLSPEKGERMGHGIGTTSHSQRPGVGVHDSQ